MSVTINGDTGVSQIQSGAITAGDLSNVFVYTAWAPVLGIGTTYAINHGLAQAPAEANVEALCTTANNGYSIGDVLTVLYKYDNVSATNAPMLIWVDSTQVGIPMPTNYYLRGLGKEATGGFNLTPANWSYRFRMRAA